MSELVKTELNDGVLLITINRPEARNAINYETAHAMAAVFERIAGQHRLRLPMYPGNRSLNLSNAVAVTVFEAWRQHGFAGGQ